MAVAAAVTAAATVVAAAATAVRLAILTNNAFTSSVARANINQHQLYARSR